MALELCQPGILAYIQLFKMIVTAVKFCKPGIFAYIQLCKIIVAAVNIYQRCKVFDSVEVRDILAFDIHSFYSSDLGIGK